MKVNLCLRGANEADCLANAEVQTHEKGGYIY